MKKTAIVKNRELLLYGFSRKGTSLPFLVKIEANKKNYNFIEYKTRIKYQKPTVHPNIYVGRDFLRLQIKAVNNVRFVGAIILSTEETQCWPQSTMDIACSDTWTLSRPHVLCEKYILYSSLKVYPFLYGLYSGTNQNLVKNLTMLR